MIEGFSIFGRILVDGAKEAQRDLEKIDDQLEEVGDQAKRSGKQVEDGMADANQGIDTLKTGALLGVGATLGNWALEGIRQLGAWTAQAVTFGVQANASMEQYENTLTTVLKSQEAAKETLQWVNKFAAQTPFEIPELVEATTKLEIYGIKSKETLGTIGDMAAVMGKPLMQAVEAIADAQTGELERLKEFGITKKMLVDQAAAMGKGEIVNAQGQITNMEALNAALFKIMEDRYKGGMEVQSKSFNGMLSTLKDSFAQVAQILTTPLFEYLKDQLQTALPVLGAFVEYLKGDTKTALEGLTGAIGPEKTAQIMGTIERIKSGFAAFVTFLQPLFALARTMFEQLVQFWKVNGDEIIATMKGIWAVIKFVWPFILAIIQQAWTAILNVIEGSIQTIAGIINFFKALLTGNFKGMWAAVKQIFFGALQAIWGFLNLYFLFQFLGPIRALGVSMKNILQTAVNGVKDIFMSMFRTSMRQFDDMLANGRAAFIRLKNAMTQPIQDARNAISSMMEKVKSMLNFSGKFSVKIPKISVSWGWAEKMGVKVPWPNFGLSWYAQGGYVNGPQIIGAGEKGRELILPTENRKFLQPFAEAIAHNLAAMAPAGAAAGLLRVEVPVFLDSREIARAVTPGIDREMQRKRQK